MTNEEKYRTVAARSVAFKRYCNEHCSSCKFSPPHEKSCVFRWLAADAAPSIADIVAEMRTRMAGLEDAQELCDDLDAAAKRAYERIDGAMNKDMVYGESRLRELRSVMDETIGGYHG